MNGPTLQADTTHQSRIDASLLKRATQNDSQAIATMFRQFLGDEKLVFGEYLGVEGLWGFGTHSFGGLTDKRIVSLRVGFLSEVIYRDALLQFVNSGAVYQPSKLMLYVGTAIAVLLGLILTVATFGLGLLLMPFLFLMAVRGYYRLNKCGALWWVQEGMPLYVFANRSRLVRANELYRLASREWSQAQNSRR